MLGRYQVEKELGKGAMGVVYLGKDPKIGRVVAIKTMALSQEFEADELQEVKERFFREAETAGRLTHPNIVTIFDAGEEHDLCYIAMEFLKGKDLVPLHQAGQPAAARRRCVSIVARVADALGYAHTQSVVHRDIKPANMMYDPRATRSRSPTSASRASPIRSKTKTGMVLGTPSYMSPEQLAGKKIEGRSDLFSLGVTCTRCSAASCRSRASRWRSSCSRSPTSRRPTSSRVNPTCPPAWSRSSTRRSPRIPRSAIQTGEEMARRAARLPLTARGATRAAAADGEPWTSSSERPHAI